MQKFEIKKARILAMQCLYMLSVQSELTVEEVLSAVVAEGEYIEADIERSRQLVEAAWENIATIDADMVRLIKNKSLRRVGSVDKAILRLAVAELYYVAEPHDGVAHVINDWVEAAKVYSEEKSYAFVNAVITSFLKDRAPEKVGINAKD